MSQQQELQQAFTVLGELETIHRKRFLWQLAFFRRFKNDTEKDLWQSTPFMARALSLFTFAIISLFLTIYIVFPLNRVILPNSLGLIGNSAISNIALAIFNTLFAICLALLGGLLVRLAINKELNRRVKEIRRRIVELQKQINS